MTAKLLLLAAPFLAVGLAAGCPSRSQDGAESSEGYRSRRAQMIRDIEADVRATRQQIGKSRLDERVMAALANVPRHEFVPPGHSRYAYENRPLPIGEGQTISQPYVVALMTDLLDPQSDDVILEVGTGSGYQAAVLAELVEQVYSVEIVPSLGRQAAERLRRLGYDNVEVRIGDGYEGWAEHAPYDGVIVTAGAPAIPPPLLAQLKPGGRMVIPLGDGPLGEQLTLVEKDEQGEVRQRDIIPVRFVPLTGEHR